MPLNERATERRDRDREEIKNTQRQSTDSRQISAAHLAEVDVDFREAERVEADVPGRAPVQVLRLRHEGDRLAVGHAEGARGSSHGAVHGHGRHESGNSRHERSERGKGSLHGAKDLVYALG